MKNLVGLLTLAIAACMLSFTAPMGGYIDIYLVNDCGSEVDVKIRGNGSSNTFDLDAGEKVKKSVKEGYEIYVDGDLIHEVEDGDSGDEIKLCD